jgi:OmpA-OmpF porin, OOP family
MRKDKMTLSATALAASLAAAVIAPSVVNAAQNPELYWKAVPTVTAWVNPYGECWQGVEGEKLPPCGVQKKVHAPVVLNLLFELDKYQLNQIRNPQELRKIDELIKDLQSTPGPHTIEIVGMTDKLGSWEHNVVLSENRANTIKQYMIDRGFPAADIASVKGVGWEGGNDIAADGTTIDLGPLENNPLRRRVVITELGGEQAKY